MFEWLRRLRTGPDIPDAAWQATLARYRFLQAQAGADLPRLRELAARFLGEKEFYGAHDFVITDEVALAIAAQAVLPILHLPGGLAWYDDFVGIVVHGTEVVARRHSMDEAGVVHEYDEVLAGEAMDRGPIMLSWRDVRAGGISSAEGYNVVIHEFAHKIDMKDGAADGCPPLPPGFAGARNARAARAAWLAVLQPAYDQFAEQCVLAERFGTPAPWLNAYGATSLTEFFAVACEAYFVSRERFGAEHASLRALFEQFFKPNQP